MPLAVRSSEGLGRILRRCRGMNDGQTMQTKRKLLVDDVRTGKLFLEAEVIAGTRRRRQHVARLACDDGHAR